MRVAVTGAAGRLGRALVAALEDAPFTGPAGPIAWDRSAFDLDAPDGIEERLDPRPGRGRGPRRGLDRRRRRAPSIPSWRSGATPTATGVLALACARRAVDLLVISTNEVFDGLRTDGLAYRPDDSPTPGNPYGASKASAERLAADAFATAPSASLGIARTAWLFGAPGTRLSEPDPRRRRASPGCRRAAARRSATSGARRATPRTWRPPIVELLAEDAPGRDPPPGERRLASRADWARDAVARAAIDVEIRDVPMSTWDAAVPTAALGCPRPDPAAIGRAAPPMAGRDGRLRAGRSCARGAAGACAHDRGRAPGPSALPGVRYGRIDRHADERGSFRELWRDEAFPGERFVQANLSTSAAGVLRGLHLHRRQTDLLDRRHAGRALRRPRGRPAAARRGPAPAAGRRDPRARPRTSGSSSRPGVAHGFLALEPLQLVYLVTNAVRRHRRARFRLGRPRRSGCRGRRWMRPRTVGRSCPPRDASNPSLADLVERPAHRRGLTRTAPHRAAPESPDAPKGPWTSRTIPLLGVGGCTG